MKSKAVLTVFIIVCLFMGFINIVKAPAANNIYTYDNFEVLLSEDSSFGIFHAGTEIQFTAGSNWNGSSCTLTVTSNGGLFQFTPENNTDITIDYSGVDNVKVNGTGINTNTQLAYSGTSLITWNYPVIPWLPIMFIFGMIGIVSMFFGGLNFIQKMQKKQYYKAFVVSTVAIAIGISFVLAWLWS